jgi:proteic killer suppression protein
MIRSFRDARTAALHAGKVPKGVARELARRAQVKLIAIDEAERLEELASPPGNRLEKLSGDRAGQWSIRVTAQWRICFGWEDGHAVDVWFGDYH